jgi:hypothetical protein
VFRLGVDEPGIGSQLTGLRRVDWVRVVLGDGGPTAEAVGVRHRRPAATPISIAVAARLAAEGTPLVVRDRRVGTGAEV